MALINERWPLDICPESCAFGISRNDILQQSARTRETSVIAQGRPLWQARLSWAIPNNDKLAKLRYHLHALEGYAGSVQLWDFSSPAPSYLAAVPTHWVSDAVVALAMDAEEDDSQVNLKGLQASVTAVVQGQYLQIGRRIYMAVDTVVANGSGLATVELVTPLLDQAIADDEVRLVEAACEMHLIEQNWDFSSRASEGLISVSAAFRETVEDFTI